MFPTTTLQLWWRHIVRYLFIVSLVSYKLPQNDVPHCTLYKYIPTCKKNIIYHPTIKITQWKPPVPLCWLINGVSRGVGGRLLFSFFLLLWLLLHVFIAAHFPSLASLSSPCRTKVDRPAVWYRHEDRRSSLFFTGEWHCTLLWYCLTWTSAITKKKIIPFEMFYNYKQVICSQLLSGSI